MKIRFHTCDVFTSERFGGNPLAVIPDAEGLSSEQMQQIAREFNYSETTFVLPGEGAVTRQVRIFTPTQEVPFAGHPNVGTAFTLASLGELGELGEDCNVVFSEVAGLVPVSVHNRDQGIWCELKAPEPVSIGETASTEEIARALSLSPEDIDTNTHDPVVASVGLPFVVVALNSRDALQRASGYVPALNGLHDRGMVSDVLAYVRSDDEFDLHCRVFCPLDGVPEDPATGSANCALVALLAQCRSEDNSIDSWRIAQGVEMGRPSVLDARTEKADGDVTGVWVGGYCQAVSEGVMTV